MQKVLTKAKKSGMTFDVVTVTPEIAMAWLDANLKNRKPSRGTVAKYARDMTNGAWRMTGDPIRFDRNKHLIDGQHRLMACVEAGVPFTSMVVYGLEPDDQTVIDTNKARTASDMFGLDGFHYPNILTAGARTLLDMRAGWHPDGSRTVWSVTEIADCIEKNKNFPASVRHVGGKKMPRGTPYSHMAVTHYIGSHFLKEPDLADAFIDVFATGIPAYKGCPAHHIRERIIRPGPTAIRLRAKAFAIRTAWNKFRKSETVASFIKFSSEPVAYDDLDVSKL